VMTIAANIVPASNRSKLCLRIALNSTHNVTGTHKIVCSALTDGARFAP